MIQTDEKLEQVLRKSTICIGCMGEKSLDLVVCWTCFKYRTDIISLKYWTKSLFEWIQEFC